MKKILITLGLIVTLFLAFTPYLSAQMGRGSGMMGGGTMGSGMMGEGMMGGMGGMMSMMKMMGQCATMMEQMMGQGRESYPQREPAPSKGPEREKRAE